MAQRLNLKWPRLKAKHGINNKKHRNIVQINSAFIWICHKKRNISTNPCDVGATLAVARNGVVDRAGASPAPTLGDVVGAYKSMLMQICLDLCRERQETLGRFWQRNYYEHIIRDELSYAQICSYIECNPIHWQTDEHFSA